MWVNKEFIQELNEALQSFNKGQFNVDFTPFEKFKSKKYQKTIDQLLKFQIGQKEFEAEVGNLINENYKVDLEDSAECESTNRIAAVRQNLKFLTDDLKAAFSSINQKKYDVILPSRADHQEFRNTTNASLKNLYQHVEYLKLEIDRFRNDNGQLKRQILSRTQYLDEISKAAKDMAAGNDNLEFPWSDQDQTLFQSLMEVKTVFRQSIRFLQDLSNGLPEIESLPCASTSLLGGALDKVAESAISLSKKNDHDNRLIKQLEQEIKENQQFLEMASDYAEGIAKGEYTNKLPFSEDQSQLIPAMEKVRISFQEIVAAALNVAEGKKFDDSCLPKQHRLAQSAFKQMFSAIKLQNDQLASFIKDKTEQHILSQNQIKELLDYNFKFENQFQESSQRLKETLKDYQEQTQLVERLRRKNERLEEEQKSLKQKLGIQSKKASLAEERKDHLDEEYSRHETLVSHLLSEIDLQMKNIDRMLGENKRAITSSKSPLASMLQKIKDRVEKTNETIHKSIEDIKNSNITVFSREIKLQPFIQDLEQSIEEVFPGAERIFDLKVDQTVPQIIFSDEVRLKRILISIVQYFLGKNRSNQVVCNVNRGKNKLRINSVRPMIAFEISADRSLPVDIQKTELDPFDEYRAFSTEDLDGTFMGFGILRDLAAAIEGQLHAYNVQGERESYILQIPLNKPKISTIDEKEGKSHKKANNAKTIYVLEDNTAFVEKLKSGLSNQEIVCHQLTDSKEFLEIAQKNEPFSVFLGTKWMGDKDNNLVKEINKNPKKMKIPYVALTATPKIPEFWKEHCIGYITEFMGPHEYDEILARIHAFHRIELPKVGIFQSEQSQSSNLTTQLARLGTDVAAIKVSENSTDYADYTHLVCIDDFITPPELDIFEKTVKQVRQNYPDCLVISGSPKANYAFRNRTEPLSDVYLEKEQLEVERLFEVIQLIHLNAKNATGESQTKIAGFLEMRNDLMKNSSALMVSDNASDTLALRKQLNQWGLNIRVNTQHKNIISALSSQSRCDLIVLTKVKQQNEILSLLDAINKSAEYGSVPVLILNGENRRGDKEFWLDNGATYYLEDTAALDPTLSAIRISLGSRLIQ